MATQNQFALFKTKRFLPLFVAVVAGAFNDNAFRLSLTTLYTYIAAENAGRDYSSANATLAALFVLPFFLFSALAGQLADKFDKDFLIRRIKLVEIGLIALSSWSLFTDSFAFQMLCVFLAGTQAAFFGPLKYSILPQHLKKPELLGGNGMIESGTSLAILAGMLFGMFFVGAGAGREFVSVIMIGVAVAGYIASLSIPAAPAPQPDLILNRNLAAESWTLVKLAKARREVWLAILGISWFWLLGVVFLTQIETFTKDVLHATLSCATLILAVFSIATGLGAAFCNRLTGGKITLRYVPVSALLLSLFAIDLYFAAGGFGESMQNASPWALAFSLEGLRTLFDLFGIAFTSGLYVVPLFALMQARTPYYERARIVGANNIVNAAFMVGASVASIVLLKFVSVRGLYLLLGVANLGVVAYLGRLMPEALVAGVARLLFKIFYRVEVKGMENYHAAGKRVVIVPNHTSTLDGPLLSTFLPERAAFAINNSVGKAWWARPAYMLYDLVEVDHANPLSVRSLIKRVKKSQKVVIFPEGRMTNTGGLMKIHEGPAAIAHLADAMILPLRIEGAIHTPFSITGHFLRQRLLPKITLNFMPPVKLAAPKNLSGPALREHQAMQLYDIMVDMMFRSANIDRTLWEALLDARRINGGGKIVFEDIQRQPISYNRLVLGSLILGRKLAALTPNQTYVGVLLPTATATPVTIYGLHAFGRIPAMLNFSTGATNMAAACVAAKVRTIITSRKFIEVGEMQPVIDALSQNCKIIYLEDVRGTIGLGDKLRGLFSKYAPQLALALGGATRDPNAPAVVLFTSGSEGLPKGVVLSHRNIVANGEQVLARIALNASDTLFCALPVFHAFGFLSMALSVQNGMKAFLYPSPLHYKIIPELVYETNATVLFSSDTFLANYARNAHPYDFSSVRLLVGGAERVKPETRALCMEKFGLRIIEGYGVTECAPVIAANTFMFNKLGTVGRIFDGMEYKLAPVPGVTEGGRLLIKGPNVMLGYLRADNPGEIEPAKDGWHDTGDIVSVDEWKYVTILGRAKRFAKIAGEMVSLTSVEAKLQAIYPDAPLAVVAVPDKKRGEQLVLFTSDSTIERKTVLDGMKKQGATELMVPKTIVTLETLPLLGTGKTDYVALGRLALDKVEA